MSIGVESTPACNIGKFYKCAVQGLKLHEVGRYTGPKLLFQSGYESWSKMITFLESRYKVNYLVESTLRFSKNNKILKREFWILDNIEITFHIRMQTCNDVIIRFDKNKTSILSVRYLG